MPLPRAILTEQLPRAPGVLLIGGSVGAAATIGGTPLGLIASAGLAILGAAGLAARSPRPGDRPVHGLGRPGEGSFLVGHARSDRDGAAVSVPWSAAAGGVLVEGDGGGAGSDLVNGIALQAAAIGRPVIVLALGNAGDRSTSAILDAAFRAGLGGDVRTFGGTAPTAALDPFTQASEEELSCAIAGFCPGLQGDTPAAVQARLLLPVACGLFRHLASAGDQRHGPVLFDECIRIDALDKATRFEEGRAAHAGPELRARILRYLAGMPGYVPDGKQPSSLLWAHAAAENLLRDGLARIGTVCEGSVLMPVDDALSAGRVSILRYGASMAEAGYVLGLIGTAMNASRGPRPVIVATDLDALPGDLVRPLLSLGERGCDLVAKVGAHKDRDDLRAFAGECGVRLTLRGGPDERSLTLHLGGARPRRLYPLPLRVPGDALQAPEPRRLAAPLPPPEDRERSSRSLATLGILLSRETTWMEPMADVTIETLSARLPNFPLGTDAAAAQALADLAGPDAPCTEDELGPAEGAPPRTDGDSDAFDAGRTLDDIAARGLYFPDLYDLPDYPIPDFPDFEAELAAATRGPGRAAPRYERPTRPFAAHPDGSHVVFPSTLREDPGLGEGNWRRLAGQPIPFTSRAAPDEIRSLLDLEFPYLGEVNARVAGWLGIPGPVGGRPLLFVGPSGVGKTRYARRLCEWARLKWGLYPCGGAPEGGFLGAPRQWSGARPGYVPALVARERVANPAVILDGLDEAAPDNAQLLAGVRNLLDPEVSARYHDPYLDAQIDLSRVVWFATATDPGRLPPSLVDRFRVVRIDPPGAEHAGAVTAFVIGDRDANLIVHPDYHDIVDAARARWSGASIRELQRIVEEVVAAASPTLTPEA